MVGDYFTFIHQANILIITTSKKPDKIFQHLLCACELSRYVQARSHTGVIISHGHACYSVHCTASHCCFVNSALFFFRVTSHLTNCDIFMSLCSFISQPPINPKLCYPAYCKQAALEGKGCYCAVSAFTKGQCYP